MKFKAIAAIAFCASSATGLAGAEEVYVTGLRASESYSGTPAVVIRKPADFLVQEVELVNDSRSSELRRKEIFSTIEGMIKGAAADRKIALSYGKGFLLPVDLRDDSLRITDGRERPDTSSVRIFVKTTLAPGDDVKARMAELRKFITHVDQVGRTEIQPVGEMGLSIVDPEKYRYEIFEKIADENRRMVKAIGGKCKVTMGEMGSRVRWQRTETAELTLYISYSVEVNGCTYEQ